MNKTIAWKWLGLTSLLLVAFEAHAQVPKAPHVKFYSVSADFATVKDDVKQAITARGLVIDHTSHIGAMLDRTGVDIGQTKPIFVHADAYQFCSAQISRKTMEADPANIVFCPYVILIYTLRNDPTVVYVGYRRPQPVGSPASQESLKAVDKLLDDIVKEALNVK